MEMITDYAIPQSWDDKGMDWENPDPLKADYAMAIREALLERFAVAGGTPSYRSLAISPWKTVSKRQLASVVDDIRRLCGSFVNMEREYADEGLEDFPKMWTYSDLTVAEPIYAEAAFGSLCRDGGAWLAAIRRTLDRLTVVKAGRVHGRTLVRSGDEHDPPFGESISSAMAKAFADLSDTRHFGAFPTSVCGWSGNTHWMCPKPNDKGDPEDNRDGYCGYAESQAYRITAAESRLLGAHFDIFAGVVVTAPAGAVPYSSVLDESLLDAAGCGFHEGLNWTERVRVKDPYDFAFALGDADAIPQNALVPTSEFDDEGNATVRHSCKTGWEGRACGFLDYGVENGFRFYRKE